jgi:SAM-dependent methyltransferase
LIPAEQSKCPLCQHQRSKLFYQNSINEKTYFRCGHCQLVYLSIQQRLTLAQERALYSLHQNQIEDPQYRAFLSRIFTPLAKRVPAPAKVLDYGCGPGPALASIFSEAGYQVSLYDPYFHPDNKVLEEKYQIVTLTEVIEHCHNPLQVLDKIKSLLKPNGILGIMTKRVTQPEKFANWHYKNDPTHVCFFSESTFQWIAEALVMELEICGDDSVLLKNVVL